MATTPEALYPALCEATNRGDIEALIALYDEQAVYVLNPGRVTSGRTQLRQALQRVIDLRGRLSIAPGSCVRCGDQALVLGTYTLIGRRADGSPFEQSSRFADVLRATGGHWRILIDNPFGAE